MRVLKFGGTSVGSSENIQKVLAILSSYDKDNIEFVAIFSAVGGQTNKLVEMSEKAANQDESYLSVLKEFEEKHISVIRDLIDVKSQSNVFAHIKQKLNELEDYLQGVFLLGELSERTQDAVLSFGEQLSVFIISAAAKEKGLNSKFVDAREVIKTDSNFCGAKVNFVETNKNIKTLIKDTKKINFVTGFISSDDKGVTTTLGRGGSDYTASIFAAALDAEVNEIWTDVDGVMTADPRKVKNAFSLDAITYSEAMEMSHFGAKVIYPPTLQPVFAKRIPIRIKNTFNPSYAGTLISDKSGEVQRMRVKGISSINDISLVTVQGSGMIGVSGFSARLFNRLAQNQTNIIMITQASSEHSITFAVAPGEGDWAKQAIEEEFEFEIAAGRLDKVLVVKKLAVIAIIGENMSQTPGISGIMFSALGRNGINITAIAQGSSELNISTVIDKEQVSKALNTLHDAFFLSSTRTLNLFMVGPGLIGSALLEQIKDQHQYLKTNKALDIRLITIANSRQMLLNEDGIDLSNWKTDLEKVSGDMSLDIFVEKMIELDLPNSVFVDNTSNKEITKYYEQILDASIAIVTPNKVANSSEYSLYNTLKDTAARRGVKFMYETNVGAGLPIIGTLQDLVNSGDEIIKVEGVLSGSLSYIFNTYDGSTSFKDVVLQAKELGFTEPDPRDDLNGMDVARKILILARESGLALEPKDINVQNPLPKACIDAKSVDEFWIELEKNNKIFDDLAKVAKEKQAKLCFIASLKEGKCNVSLQTIEPNHPLFGLAGSDNMISFTTKRYETNPLVIQGPGAGAEVTAAGVFADIIKINNY